jgi:hypothetical protein
MGGTVISDMHLTCGYQISGERRWVNPSLTGWCPLQRSLEGVDFKGFARQSALFGAASHSRADKD